MNNEPKPSAKVDCVVCLDCGKVHKAGGCRPTSVHGVVYQNPPPPDQSEYKPSPEQGRSLTQNELEESVRQTGKGLFQPSPEQRARELHRKMQGFTYEDAIAELTTIIRENDLLKRIVDGDGCTCSDPTNDGDCASCKIAKYNELKRENDELKSSKLQDAALLRAALMLCRDNGIEVGSAELVAKQKELAAIQAARKDEKP